MAANPGERAADFRLKALDGKTVALSSLRGKVVLVDFWASWCEPCKRELPILQEMAARLRGRGIEILTVNLDRERANVEAFLKLRAIALPVLLNPDLSVADRFQPPKMPSSYVIDRKGLVRYVNAGFEPGDEKAIEKQLLDVAGK